MQEPPSSQGPQFITRTYHADQAIQMSELIQLKFSTQRFGTTSPRTLKIIEPDGPSTDGGRKARQSIVLAPEDPANSTQVVCGWLDASRRSAEMKSYQILKEGFQSRYTSSLDLSRGEYERLLTQMQEFMRTQAIDLRVSQVAHHRRPSLPPGATVVTEGQPQLHWGVVLASGFMFGFLVCYLLFVA